MVHLVGIVAHIVAGKDEGPRGCSALTPEQRNAEPNLLLLCSKHHKIVDDDPKTYTVQALRWIKTDHEKWVASSLSAQPVWKTKLYQLYYVNVPRLSLLSSLQGMGLDLSRHGRIEALHELGLELTGLMAGFEKLLRAVQLRAVDVSAAINSIDARGLVVSFDHEFRTRNIVLPQPGESFKTFFSGNPKKDAHIYCRINDWKIVANIDRRWITTTTAFCQFRPSSGRNRFAGLGFVNATDKGAKSLSLTPYVIGMPSNEFVEEFWGRDA